MCAHCVLRLQVGSSALAAQVACIRETFEETGVVPYRLPSRALLGSRAAVNANAAAFTQFAER